MRQYIVWAQVACVSLLINACGGGSRTAPEPVASGPAPEETGVLTVLDDAIKGLKMALFDAPFKDTGRQRPAPVEAAPLTADETTRLLSRIDALETPASDKATFRFPAGSLPAPTTGAKISKPFPSLLEASPPPMGEPGTLEVLRYAPSGMVSLAPHLSVTFSRPMVPVSGQDDTAGKVPVSLSPMPAGRWRWIGTQTALFEPEGRFPQATRFTVRIPAGAKAATGERLSEAVSFTFTTPALEIERSFPSTDQPQPLQPTIVMAFNQAVDPGALIPFVSLRSDKGLFPVGVVETDVAAAEAGESGAAIRDLIHKMGADRILAVRPVVPLPKATLFDVVVKKGAPSAEGPRRSRRNLDFSFRTYAPFAVEKSRCDWQKNCPPSNTWRIMFTNPVDLEVFDPAEIKVRPEVPGLTVAGQYRGLTLRGMPNGRTRYTVTLPAALKDTFGQTLGKDTEVVFDVGAAEKALFGPTGNIVTLDPTGPKAVPIHTVNHDGMSVEIRAVEPGDFFAFQSESRAGRPFRPGGAKRTLTLPGKRLFSGRVDIAAQPDALTETALDLSPYLKNGFGQLLVRVVPTAPKNLDHPETLLFWVQVTGLGLTAFVDNGEIIAWTTALADGHPVADAQVTLLGKKGQASKRSDKSGLVRFNLAEAPLEGHTLVATRGDDRAMLPHTSDLRWGGGTWKRISEKSEVLWYVFDDRGTYKPGETAKIKGWLRRFDPNKNGDIGALDPRPKAITWSLLDSRRNEIAAGKVPVSRLGGFDLSVDLPEEMNLGAALLELKATPLAEVNRGTWTHYLSVEAFRRPTYEVTMTGDSSPFLLGETAFMTVSAQYFAGGALPFAPTHWSVSARPAHFAPPNREGYHFGPWAPWWQHFGPEMGESSRETFSGETDGSGMHRIGIRFEGAEAPRPMSVRVEGQVMDARQGWTASRELLVHPSARYIGLRSGRNFVGKGESIEIHAVAVTLDGEAIPGTPMELVFAKLEPAYGIGGADEHGVEAGRCSVTSGTAPSRCVFSPQGGGLYRIRGEVRDDRGRLNRTDVHVWVSGAEAPTRTTVEKDAVALIPEKERYQPGETATFMVQAPFYPAEGLLTVRRSGVVKTEPFHMAGPTTVLSVPIEESYIPNIFVQVDLVGAAPRKGDGDVGTRPAFASGGLTFEVPPLKRTLDVVVKPKETVLVPGGETVLEISVTDADGAPVKGAELAVVAADESVLSLSGYTLPDPIALFYAARRMGVTDYHLRQQVLLPSLGEMKGGEAVVEESRRSLKSAPAFGRGGGGAAEMAPMAAVGSAPAAGIAREGGGGAVADSAIAVRKAFEPLALFAPEVVTDRDGRATVALKLPDSLTRYRIMAVAVSGEKQFGKGASAVTARLPLMVRPAPPRFLNFGDRFALPVLLHNQTDAAMTVDVAVRGGNIAFDDAGAKPRAMDAAGKRVTVPPRDRVEVMFPGRTVSPGTARLQVAAASASVADGKAFFLPVYTPATAEAFAAYGTVDDGAVVQPVSPPSDIFSAFGGLDVSFQSTELMSLTDAVLYLVTYPFECSEQIASKILAIVALKDVLDAFDGTALPPEADLVKAVRDGIEALRQFEDPRGGYRFWRDRDTPWPYLSVHVAHAHAVAREKGFDVPGDIWKRDVAYLETIENHLPDWYSEASRLAIRAYAVYVLGKMGEDAGTAAAALVDAVGVDRLPLEALGWVWPSLGKKGGPWHRQVRQRLLNNVAETAAGAHFVTDYADGAYVLLHSERRVDGVLLDALIALDPGNDLIPKLVRGLLGNRVKGRWVGTQENAFVLLALSRYFSVFEKTTPNFVAKAWLGDRLAVTHAFEKRTTDRVGVQIPMRYVTEAEAPHRVTIEKAGKGRLYYRLGMTYAPKRLVLEPADYGFSLRREYAAVDNPEDVRRDADGVWHLKAGARVRVKLTMAVPMRRYHVALVDPLPAGVETINPDFANSGDIPQDPDAKGTGRYWWWHRPWFAHQNLRDERTEAFTTLLWPGVHDYAYVVRATTPGRYVVPPTRAEEMYHPETFGRTGTDTVVVE